MKGMSKDDRTRKGGSSPVSKGVEHGLSEHRQIDGLDPGQCNQGPNQVPCPQSGSAGSRNGKSFKWK